MLKLWWDNRRRIEKLFVDLSKIYESGFLSYSRSRIVELTEEYFEVTAILNVPIHNNTFSDEERKTHILWVTIGNRIFEREVDEFASFELYTCRFGGSRIRFPAVLSGEYPDGASYRLSDMFGMTEIHYDSDIGEWRFNNEFSDDEDEDMGVIHDYSYDVLRELDFCSTKADAITIKLLAKEKLGFPYLGVELEVESKKDYFRNDVAKEIKDLLPNFLAMKDDGSLDCERGFEIVSAPASLAFHQQTWQKFFDGPGTKVHSYSGTNGRCGMHVHISRDSMHSLHLGKLIVFYNAKDNEEFISKMAGRAKSHYAEIKHNKKISDSLNWHTHNKYEAVNLCHHNSIEIRVFKGNASPLGFMKNLEFVHASWAFTKDAANTHLTKEDFLLWIADQRHNKTYPNLKFWLVRQELIPADAFRKNLFMSNKKENKKCA